MKNQNNILYRIRLLVAFIVFCLCGLGFLGFYYPIPLMDIQVIPLLQRLILNPTGLIVLSFVFIILITVLFGRIYCSTLCPFGILQEFLFLLFRKKDNSYSRATSVKYFFCAFLIGGLIGGTSLLIQRFDPYSLFGSIVSGTLWGGFALFIIAGLVYWKGRYFCAQVCPVGTMLGILSKYSIFQVHIDKKLCVACALCARQCPTGSINIKTGQVNNETCVKCFKCLTKCARGSIYYGKAKEKKNIFVDMDKRRWLTNSAILGVFLISIKGGFLLAKTLATSVKKIILPPGARSSEEFINKCLNCNLCVQNCPMGILKKANATYPAIHIAFQKQYCQYDCKKCSDVCSSGALRRMSLEEKQRTQIGLSQIDTGLCVKCGRCVRNCPREAVTKKRGEFPIVSEQKCIGCGKCQSVCPVHAISIKEVETQKLL